MDYFLSQLKNWLKTNAALVLILPHLTYSCRKQINIKIVYIYYTFLVLYTVAPDEALRSILGSWRE